MNFPARSPHAISPPAGLKEALGVTPKETLSSVEDLLVLLDSEKAVGAVQPDFPALAQIAVRGIIVTASGDQCDFVSRFFAPRIGVPEDPVTGSSHCVLAPYWAGVLGKNDLHAFQLSKRSGELFCTNAGDRVKISGRAALYLEGTITA
ncbi:MAG: PhzF family phenazine biosynthesis protein [Methanothrix sp.]|nr:PhzF family phenazine biosynthesis protein [Methanothrix sp.]